MRALARLPSAQGIAAMQAINVAILNPVFGLVFGDSAILCAVLAVSSLVRWDEPNAGYLLAGSVMGFVGSTVVTGLFNVPLNNALADIEPESAAGKQLWSAYVSRWTSWNHLRTVASLAATALLILAIR